jgi:heme/copper-type cytochrome/quinol oxidase subunit 2
MPVVVEVKTQAEFDAWLEAQKAARQASAAPAAQTAAIVTPVNQLAAVRVANAE